MNATTKIQSAPNVLGDFLQGYTAEVTARDKKSIAAAREMMAPGSEVFVASLPKDKTEDFVNACVAIRKAGLTPVPHIVARNTATLAELDTTLGRLVAEAGVDRALSLGGDRDDPKGEFTSSLELIETGLYEKHGFKKLYIGCYPEGHPRIDDAVLLAERAKKLAAIEKIGLDVELISQFCFDAKPILEMAKAMRIAGITAPYRIGVAGPASRATLIKYAVICGVGPSLRALKERQELAKSVAMGETPEALIREVAEAVAANPDLGISGVHFFTFGSLASSAKFAAPLL